MWRLLASKKKKYKLETASELSNPTFAESTLPVTNSLYTNDNPDHEITRRLHSALRQPQLELEDLSQTRTINGNDHEQHVKEILRHDHGQPRTISGRNNEHIPKDILQQDGIRSRLSKPYTASSDQHAKYQKDLNPASFPNGLRASANCMSLRL